MIICLHIIKAFDSPGLYNEKEAFPRHSILSSRRTGQRLNHHSSCIIPNTDGTLFVFNINPLLHNVSQVGHAQIDRFLQESVSLTSPSAANSSPDSTPSALLQRPSVIRLALRLSSLAEQTRPTATFQWRQRTSLLLPVLVPCLTASKWEDSGRKVAWASTDAGRHTQNHGCYKPLMHLRNKIRGKD